MRPGVYLPAILIGTAGIQAPGLDLETALYTACSGQAADVPPRVGSFRQNWFFGSGQFQKVRHGQRR